MLFLYISERLSCMSYVNYTSHKLTCRIPAVAQDSEQMVHMLCTVMHMLEVLHTDQVPSERDCGDRERRQHEG